MTIKDRVGGIVLVGVVLTGLTFLGLRGKDDVVPPPDGGVPIVQCGIGFHEENGVCVVDNPGIPTEPTSTFTQSTQSVISPGIVGFTIEPHDPKSLIVWNFGDGSQDVLNKKVVNHEYLSSGNFVGVVTVTDSEGKVEQFEFNVFVEAGTPLPGEQDIITNFIQTQGTIFSGDSVGFSLALGVAVDQVTWDFGDGSNRVLNQISVDHRYNQTGTFNGFVEAIASGGGSERIPFTVRVEEAVSAIITLDLQVGAAAGSQVEPGENVNFQAVAGGGVPPFVSYEWDFGDGQKTVTQSPFANHTFLSEGNFTVKVTVTDSVGNNKSDSVLLSVKSLPAQFGDVTISITETPQADLDFAIDFFNERSDLQIIGSSIIRVFDGQTQIHARTNQFAISPLSKSTEFLDIRDNWRRGVPLVLFVEYNDVNGKLLNDASLTFTIPEDQIPDIPQVAPVGTVDLRDLRLEQLDFNTLRSRVTVENLNPFPIEGTLELDPTFINPDGSKLPLDTVVRTLDLAAGETQFAFIDFDPFFGSEFGTLPGSSIRVVAHYRNSQGERIAARDLEQINFKLL